MAHTATTGLAPAARRSQHSAPLSAPGPMADPARRAAAVQAWMARHGSRQRHPYFDDLGGLDHEPARYPVAMAVAVTAALLVIVWRFATVAGVL